jgi:hypothetical protein
MRAPLPSMVALKGNRTFLFLLMVIWLGIGAALGAPEPRVLVYTRNQVGPGLYVHDNIAASVAALRKLGADHHFGVEVSDAAGVFTEANLRQL